MNSPIRLLKLLPVLTIFLGLLLLAGCNDDDPEPVSKLVGTWSFVSSETVLFVGDQTIVEYLVSLGYDRATAQQFADELALQTRVTDAFVIIEFKKDGTYTATDGSDRQEGKWELSSDEKILTLDKSTNSESPADVVTLTDAELVLNVALEDEIGPGGVKYASSMKFKKL